MVSAPAASHTPPHLALRHLLLRLGTQHELLDRSVLLLRSLQRGKVHAHAREVLDAPVQRRVRGCKHQLEHVALGVLVRGAHGVQRVMERVRPCD